MTEDEILERKAERAVEARKVRDSLLKRCDWSHALSDWDVPKKEDWRLYRASLRDLPAHPLFPELSQHSDEYPRNPENDSDFIQRYIYDEDSENKWVINPYWIDPETQIDA